MGYATNPMDGVKTYFEDDGGTGPPVLFYSGLTDPLEASRDWGLSRALSGKCRQIFADHRGHGRSDKPHETESYRLQTRVADVVAVLDELGLDRVHFVGLSWGARLGYAVGEHAPERILSLVLCGNQPYAWNPDWPIVRQLMSALPDLQDGGMVKALETWESTIGRKFPEPERTRMLANDPKAIIASCRSLEFEGPISSDLTKWRLPCLIYAGQRDDMHDNAQRSANEIPGAIFLSIKGRNHFTVAEETTQVLPHVLRQFGLA